MPIITAAGIVYPGWNSANGGQVGTFVTSAEGGSTSAGTGGSLAPCSVGASTQGGSIAGSSAIGPAGGTGGNASSLAPNYAACTLSAGNCQDPGSGGGGGGGYFGGGGGATGFTVSGNCPPSGCNGATTGQGGGGGSSFVSNQLMDPVDESILEGAPANGVAVVVPAIEIDSPSNNAVYTPGQAVHASWSCGYDTSTGLGVSSCTGTAATGSAIDTTPGTHTFTVTGGVSSNGNQTVHATVTYTVAAAEHTTHASLAGFKFTLTYQSACMAPHGKLAVTLAKSGVGKGYRVSSFSYYLGHAKPALVTSHTGTVHVSLGTLKAGSHRITLVIKLVPTKGHARAKTKTLTLPFSIC